MKLSKVRRDKIVDELVGRDIDNVRSTMNEGGYDADDYLDEVFRVGFKGYANWSDDDLVYEFEDWTETKVKDFFKTAKK